uniref:Activating transcription factor 7 interacting protein n=1 Tax=Lepisosteus oculatus TaxID=7918 RepID=W5N281_LEPOC
MDVAVAEEPQKKVFRARKTMRASDRQQLESIHRTRESSPKTGDPPNFPTLTSSPSSAPAPDAATPLVNGKHPDNEAAPQGSPQRQGREASSSPAPRPLGAAGSPSLVLSLSFSPSQAEADEGPEPLNPSSPSLSPGPGDPAAALKKAEASRGPPCTAPGLSNGTSEEEEGEGQGQGQGEAVRTPSPPAGEERGDTRREAESVGGKAPSPIILLTPLEKEQIQRERESPAQVRLREREGSEREREPCTGGTAPEHTAGTEPEHTEHTLQVLPLSTLQSGLCSRLRERLSKRALSRLSRCSRQAKYARLAKKWGAANQAREDARKTQELSQAASAGTPSAAPSAAYRRSSTTVRTMLDSRRAEPPGQTPVAPAAGGAPQPVQIKAVAQPAAASVVNTVVTPVLSIISTAASTGPTSTSVSAPAPLGQPGGLTLKAAPLTAGVTTSVASSSTPGAAPQPISIQPLLIQLPLSVAAAPQGALVSSPAPGIELIPVSAAPGRQGAGPGPRPDQVRTLLTRPSPPHSLRSSACAPNPAAPRGDGAPSAPQTAFSFRRARTGPLVRWRCRGAIRDGFSQLHQAGPLSALGSPLSLSSPLPDTQATNRAPDSTTRALPQAGRPSSSGAVIDLTEDDDDVQVTGVKKAPVQAQSPSSTSTSSSSSQQPLGQRAPPPPAPVAPAPTATPQTQDPSSTRPAAAPPSSCPPPPLPVHPAPLPSPPPPPGRLPPEAASTSPPQKPQLKLARVQSQNGIVLSWSVTEVDRSCAAVDSYHLYAYHEEPAPAAPPSQWKKIGEVKALPLPMACTLTQFVSGSKYYFAVRARDVYGRFGPFCDPQSTDVIAAASSS